MAYVRTEIGRGCQHRGQTLPSPRPPQRQSSNVQRGYPGSHLLQRSKPHQSAKRSDAKRIAMQDCSREKQVKEGPTTNAKVDPKSNPWVIGGHLKPTQSESSDDIPLDSTFATVEASNSTRGQSPVEMISVDHVSSRATIAPEASSATEMNHLDSVDRVLGDMDAHRTLSLMRRPPGHGPGPIEAGSEQSIENLVGSERQTHDSFDTSGSWNIYPNLEDPFGEEADRQGLKVKKDQRFDLRPRRLSLPLEVVESYHIPARSISEQDSYSKNGDGSTLGHSMATLAKSHSRDEPSHTESSSAPATYLKLGPLESSQVSNIFGPSMKSQGIDFQPGLAPMTMVATPKLSDGVESFLIPKGGSTNELWLKIRATQIYIWRLRSDLQHKRRELRELRNRNAAADNRYFRFVRAFQLGMTHLNQDISSEQETLKKLYEECSRTRDEYGPLEDDCITLENDLELKEYELQTLEAKYESRPANQPAERAADRIVSSNLAPSESSSESDSSSEPSREYHPLVVEFMSKLGDVDILKERYGALMDEWEYLAAEKTRRAVVGRDLMEDDEEWLRKAPKLEDDLVNDIKAAETEAGSLKLRCLRQGLIDDDGEPLDFHARETIAFKYDLESTPESSVYSKYPTLLPHLAKEQIKIFDQTTKRVEKTEGSEDRVSPWLLQIMRLSPLEVILLATTYELVNGKKAEGQEWQISVLFFWYKDGKWKHKSGHTITSSGEITEAPKMSKNMKSLNYRAHDNDSRFVTRHASNAPLGSDKGLVFAKNGNEVVIPFLVPRSYAKSF